MKTKILSNLLFFLIVLSSSLYGQVHGFVEDSKTGERLPGASISTQDRTVGVITNNFGFFSISNPALLTSEVVVSYVGYTSRSLKLERKEDGRMLVITLDPSSEMMTEVEITAERPNRLIQARTGLIELPVKTLSSMPSLGGEADLIKALTFIPEVQFALEGTTNISIRGGAPDQNLVLVDDVPIYNVSHLFGVVSIFDTEALKYAALSKGGFPARYGGRVSSVLDLRLREGNMQEFKGSASIGVLSSRLLLEGPIVKNKMSFLVSGRRSFYDLFVTPIMKYVMSEKDSKTYARYYFYDINGKLNYFINAKNRVYLSFYSGKDPMSLNGESKKEYDDFIVKQKNKYILSYGNEIASLRWSYVSDNGYFANTTLKYCRYTYQNSNSRRRDIFMVDDTLVSQSYLGLSSGVTDLGLRSDQEFRLGKYQQIRLGGELGHYIYEPGVEIMSLDSYNAGSNNPGTENKKRTTAYGAALYVEDEFSLFDRLYFNMGYRFNFYQVEARNYVFHEPRVSLSWLAHDRLALKASYGKHSQFIHLLTNSGISLPTDLWVPTTANIKPVVSEQYSIGLQSDFMDKTYELGVEVFIKELQNVIEYKDGMSFTSQNSDWETLVEAGRGHAKGLELMFEKKTGKLKGWISYTLSKATREFDNINYGKEFLYKYHRLHNFSTALNYQLTKNGRLGVNWIFASGNPVTFSLSGTNTDYEYFYSLFPYPSSTTQLNRFGRNNYILPAYHRMDISYEISRTRKWGESAWTFSVYNVYNRLNAAFLDLNYDMQGHATVEKFSPLPFIPGISYSIKF